MREEATQCLPFSALVSSCAESDPDSGGGGAPQTFVPGWYDVTSLNIVGNDMVSSLTAGPNFRITVCSEAGFWGDCQDFTGSVPYVGDLLNDRISSLIVTAL